MLPSQRSLFSLPDDLHYLNCAYMSPLARPVEEAGIAGMLQKRNPAAERKAELVTVRPPAGPGRGEGWNRAVLEAIDARTALLALPHVHWADGTVFDLVRIAARARDVGAALVVDGTQSVGAFPFPYHEIRPDALVCAGYKWLMGPYSTGVAVYGERFDGGVPLEENWIARLNSENFAGLVDYEPEYAPGVLRYDVGERSNFILMPMLLAALRLVRSWGVDQIQSTVRALSDPIVERARELGYGVEDREYRAGHLFGIRTPKGIDLDALRSTLAERRISVSVRGDAIRVAPHVYNGAQDAEALVRALEHVVR